MRKNQAVKRMSSVWWILRVWKPINFGLKWELLVGYVSNLWSAIRWVTANHRSTEKSPIKVVETGNFQTEWNPTGDKVNDEWSNCPSLSEESLHFWTNYESYSSVVCDKVLILIMRINENAKKCATDSPNRGNCFSCPCSDRMPIIECSDKLSELQDSSIDAYSCYDQEPVTDNGELVCQECYDLTNQYLDIEEDLDDDAFVHICPPGDALN